MFPGDPLPPAGLVQAAYGGAAVKNYEVTGRGWIDAFTVLQDLLNAFFPHFFKGSVLSQ
jgi:hypothetical protein